MACIVRDKLNCHISGLMDVHHNTKENAIWYKIQVDMDSLSWFVERRYSDFEALHKKLVDILGIPRDNINLPPKKLIGNKDPQFVEQRKEQLDLYLKNLIKLLGNNPPDDLVNFLNLSEFELIFMLKKLALDVFEKGDLILHSGSSGYTLTPYQIHAISERMKMAIPPLDSNDKRHDFSHIIDFCSKITFLEIVGSNIPLGKSTIIPNLFSMSLSPFKSIKKIHFKMINVENLKEVEPVRQTVERITIQNSNLESINHFLLCDTLYKKFEDVGTLYVWPKLKYLNLNNNIIKHVDDIGSLVPSLIQIDLSFNQLTKIFDLTSLPYLEQVNYSGNMISELSDLHLLFGNIKCLNLSRNKIKTLDSFSKLYSLVVLNLSCNKVGSIEQVNLLSDLPCLEVLILTGNPVASSLDYRVRTLASFGSKANDISLDNEKASLVEMDQISILQAIEMARKTTI